MKTSWILIYTFFLLRCGGVEIGNPHVGGGDEESLAVSIEIADGPLDDIENIFITMTSMTMVHEDGREIYLALNEKGLQPIDILSLSDGLTEEIVENSLIPKGNYTGYVINFSREKPVRFLKSGEEFIPRITEEDTDSLFIEEALEVTEGGTFILHMDLFSSLQEKDGSYVFDPIISAIHKKRASSIQGVFKEGLEKGYVCAYRDDTNLSLINADIEKDFSENLNPRVKDFKRKARKPSSRKRGRPLGGERRLCDQGFAGSRLKEDGKFGFHFLPPGLWSLRVYQENGETFDSVEAIFLDKGERKVIEDLQWVKVEE